MLRNWLSVLVTAGTLGAATITPPEGLKFEQPQVALGERIAAVTFGSPDKVWLAVSRDGGASFAAPVMMAEQPGLMLRNHRGPRVAITAQAIVVSAISDPSKGGTGDLVAWRSTDGGRTWSKPVTINSRAKAAEEGLHAMVAGPDGRIYAAWLDDRTHGKQLWMSVSSDGGATWQADRKIYESPDGTICECCHPSIAVTDEGTLFVMFRNWLNGSRDMHLAVSRDAGKTFRIEKIGQGTWPLKACPMDGGGLTASGRTVTIVFRREGTIYVDQPGEPEVEIGRGKNAALAGSVVLWQTPEGLVAQTSEAKPSLVDPHGTYPSAAARGERTLVAWQSDGRIMVTGKLP